MLELRTVTDGEFEAWLRAESRAHGNRLAHDPEQLRPTFDLDRSIVVLDGGEIVGGAHSHQVDLTIPGGSVPIAGVSNVAVQPTHRRRGVMTQMMLHQLQDVHRRGEPLAALFATESAIYGRFGYGVGSHYERWTIDRHHTTFSRSPKGKGQISFVDPLETTARFSSVFARCIAGRPGVFPSAALRQWGQDSRLPEHHQGGRGGLFHVVYEEDGQVDGYATYRTSNGTVTVNELMGATTDAVSALWRFCFDTDLMHSMEALKRPVDDPLPWLLADPRRLQRMPRDGVWLRIVDVADALSRRAYAGDGLVVLAIIDDVCPWNNGRFRLEVSGGAGSAVPSEAPPDLSLTVSALASAFLGGAALTTLAKAGIVEEKTPGALFLADRMFASQLRPWTPHNF